MYRSSTLSIVNSIESIVRQTDTLFQSIFFQTAFYELLRISSTASQKGELEYERHRMIGGMKIELKDLSESYLAICKEGVRADLAGSHFRLHLSWCIRSFTPKYQSRH